jgi:hypothetical protein
MKDLSPTNAGALEIPDDALMISYRTLCPGGFERPTLDDHRAGAQELILALLERGWAISPPAPDTLSAGSTADREHTRNIDLGAEEEGA